MKQAKQRMIRNELTSKYSSLFMKSRRVSSKSGKAAMVLEPEHRDQFFSMLKDDVTSGRMELQFAAAIAISMSTGMRVGELVKTDHSEGLKTGQVDLVTGEVNQITVLKTREEQGVVRDGQLHPVALEIVRMFVFAAKRRPHERLIRLSSSQVNRRIKAYINPKGDHHALARHGFFTFLNHSKVNTVDAKNIMAVKNMSVVEDYMHTNAKKKLKDLYARKAA